jgi:uncharacterized protein (TIGR00251 family)
LIDLSVQENGTVVSVVAQPGARRTAILGERAGSLRVAVTAAPEKGKANAAIAALLAEELGCRSSRVALISGETSRQKRFLIEGLTTDEIRQRLEALLPGLA